jgi:hypothetical protein
MSEEEIVASETNVPKDEDNNSKEDEGIDNNKSSGMIIKRSYFKYRIIILFSNQLLDNVESSSNNNISKIRRQFRRMSEALCDALTDLGMVSFLPMNIQDVEVI